MTFLRPDAGAQEKISEPESSGSLVFGMSTALTGPSRELGIGMRAGFMAAFERANRAGGVHGKKLVLESLDDGYEPRNVPANVTRLIGDERVLAIVGNVGTPTAVAALPLILSNKILLFAPYTGGGILRKVPPDRYVINFRAGYSEETRAMLDALLNEGKVKPEEIAFFTQQDSYGDAGYAGIKPLLEELGASREIVHARYDRNTLSVENGLADILLATPSPKAVIMVGTYEPCAKFIRLAKANGLHALFMNVSFVGSSALAERLGKEAEGVIVTQVVPHFESDLPIVNEYRDDLGALGTDHEPGFISLEGYVSGRILIRALEGLGPSPTREDIIEGLEALGRFDIGLGHPLTIDSSNHQASNEVWPTIYSKGKYRPLDWSELKAELERVRLRQ